MYGIMLIAVLVVTGGAIAFIGDRLGTKVGKRKLSIFGLRPRHTSIIVTIFTGICITAATFGILSAASENVRTALFGMEALNARMRLTQTTLDTTRKDLDAVTAQQTQADDELGKAQADIDKLREEQDTLRAESERLKAGNAALESQNEALLASNESLAGENASLSASNETLTASNTKLLADNETLGQSNDKLTKDNKELEHQAQDLANGLMTIREGNIAFRAGEVLASGIIKGNRPVDEVRKDFEALADVASRNVSQRLGANVGEDRVWFYQPEVDSAINTIAKSQKDMVVRIVAAGNLVRGEPVRTSVTLYPNNIIYRDGEFILASPLTITSSDEAEGDAMQFLHDINGTAVAHGMLADPIRGTVGMMDGQQFFAFVNKLASMRGNVILSAYVKGATDAMGPLRLDMHVEPGGEGDEVTR